MKLSIALAFAAMRVGDESLAPASCTVRETLWVDHYAAALYVRQKTLPEAAILDPAQPKAFRIRILDKRFMPAELPKKWRRTLEEQLDAGTMGRVRAAYRELDPGDTITVSYVPGPGVTLRVNDAVVATTPRHELIDALVLVWANGAPVAERIHRAVKRNPC